MLMTWLLTSFSAVIDFVTLDPKGFFFSPYVSVNAYFQTRYMFEIIAAMFRLVKVELFLVFLLQELFGRIVDLW